MDHPPHQERQRALLVEDDAATAALVRHELSELELEFVQAGSLEEARAKLREAPPHLLLLDLGLPDGDGRELLREERPTHCSTVVLTATRDRTTVEECLDLGATDFVSKPADPVRLLASVRNALRQSRLQEEVERLATGTGPRGFDRLLGTSAPMVEVKDLLRRASGSDITVLVTGASGTGKEVAARALHEESARREAPFVAVNCGAIPEPLIESELFGHMRGSFTGAHQDRAGCFEAANGGTLFLDEVGELPREVQVKLLRVLQEREVVRIGSSRPVPVDVRVVAATNRDLESAMTGNQFREDLYYRLAVFPVHMPPLREREADVQFLARVFLERLCRVHGRERLALGQDTQLALATHPWPGNVRELHNVLERAVLMEDGQLVRPSSLDLSRSSSTTTEHASSDGTREWEPFGLPSARENLVPLEEVERAWLERALLLCRGNVREVSRRLGIGRATIYRRMERYGLELPSDEA